MSALARFNSIHRGRLAVLAVIFLAGLVGLYATLWKLQVRNSPDELDSRIERKIIRRLQTQPIRGRILDRQGRVLAGNQVSYNLVCHVSEMRQPGSRASTIDHVIREGYRIGQLLQRPVPFLPPEEMVLETKTTLPYEAFKQQSPDLYAELVRRIETHLYEGPARPLTVYQSLSPRERCLVQERFPPVPGMEVVSQYTREHPAKSVATHILGSTGLVSGADLTDGAGDAYQVPQLRGREGIEAQYDGVLAGKSGLRMVMVDSLGYSQGEFGVQIPAEPGNDVVLSIDLQAQRIAEKKLADQRGAVVMVDVRSGEIIVMASTPGFDLDRPNWRSLASDTDGRPLLNRAVATFQPGSIVKPLAVLAFLEGGVASPDDTFECDGTTTIGNAAIRCASRYGHGHLTLEEVLACSCNDGMIQMSLRSPDSLSMLQKIYQEAGLGKRPEIDLPYAEKGMMPTAERLWRTEHRPWGPFDTALVTIGQGSISLSPLQAAMYTAAIANGGTLYRPSLVRRVVSAEGQVVQEKAPQILCRWDIRPEHFNLVRQGMRLAVASSRGSSVAAACANVAVAGKTGTAEVGPVGRRTKNAWFIGFAPYDHPQYAICVLVEGGNAGGKDAAPIAGAIFEEWFAPNR